MNYPHLAIGLPSGGEWIFILVVLVLLFGGKKLPELARGLGRSLGEFKKAKEDFEDEIETASDEIDGSGEKKDQKMTEGSLPSSSDDTPKDTPQGINK